MNHILYESQQFICFATFYMNESQHFIWITTFYMNRNILYESQYFIWIATFYMNRDILYESQHLYMKRNILYESQHFIWIFPGCRQSFPRITVKHHEALLSDTRQWSRGMDASKRKLSGHLQAPFWPYTKQKYMSFETSYIIKVSK